MKCKRRDCHYKRSVNGSEDYTCDYLIITGRPRGCKVEECDKYKPKKESAKKRFNNSGL